MPAAPSARDVADILEAIARRMREDPEFAHEVTHTVKPGVSVAAAPRLAVEVDEPPAFTAVDIVVGEGHVTVTAETANADPDLVHVSVMDKLLILGLGEGRDEVRRDVALPVAVDEDMATATFRNGVLDVVMPIRKVVDGRHRHA